MEKDEIRALIAQKIAGQGNQVDIGNALPPILEGILDNAGGGGIIEIEYADLVALRNAGKLVPGQSYRITDYVTTTTQTEEDDQDIGNTRSAGHQFDIIVVADSESVLNENARAIQHEGDTYFAHAKMAAWEIKYCLDNDRERFLWAGTYETGEDDEDIYTPNPDGKGVIYYMKDEFANECNYDFKNIQFVRKLTDGVLDNDNGEDTWVYTFNVWDGEQCLDGTIISGVGDYDCTVRLVKMANQISQEDNVDNQWYLPGNVFLMPINGESIYAWVSMTTFGNNCFNNTFGNECQNNIFGNVCGNNIFGNKCFNNTFGNECQNNIFGNECQNNIFGNGCGNNIFGNNCVDNIFGNECQNNIFGNGCGNNELQINVRYISIADSGEGHQTKNCTVLSGTAGTSQTPLAIAFEVDKDYPQFAAKTTAGVLKIWNPADLVE